MVKPQIKYEWPNKKKILIIFIFIFLCTMISAEMVNPMQIRRSEPEECMQIWDDTTVVQHIKLCNTSAIHWGVLREGKEEVRNCEAQLMVSLQQNEITQSIAIRLDSLEARWQSVKLEFDFSRFQNGDAYLTITGKNMDENYPLTILLTSGKQKLSLNHVVVNGTVKEGMYISFSYRFFSWEIFLVFAAIISLLTITVLVIAPYAKHFLVSYPIPFLYFAILVIRYIQNHVAEKGLDEWMTTPYLVNYTHGFVSKALPGTIYSLFSDYVTKEDLQIVFHMIFFVFALLVFGIMIAWSKWAESKNMKNVMNIIFLYYIVCPYSVTFYYRQWGRMEIILSILFLISGCLIISDNWRWAYVVPVLSSCAVLCHQIYIFTLYPAIFGLYVYRVFVNKDKKYLGSWILNMLVPGVLGFYIQFIGKIHFSSAEYLLNLREHTNMEVNDTMILGEYFIPTSENVYTFGVLDSKASYNQVCLILSLILLLPFIKILFAYWHRCIKKQGTILSQRIVFIIIFIIPMASLAMFITISDYGRIVNLVICAIIFLVLFLMRLDSKVFANAALETYNEINEKYSKWHVVILSCYLLILGRAVVGTNLESIVYPIANLMDSLCKHLLN